MKRFIESFSEKLPEERFEFETHHLLENQVLEFCLLFTSLLFFFFLFSFLEGVVPLVLYKRDLGREGWGKVRFPPPGFSYFNLCLAHSLFSVVNRKARAVYPCEAEHSSELSFEIGAIFEDGEC